MFYFSKEYKELVEEINTLRKYDRDRIFIKLDSLTEYIFNNFKKE